MSGSKESNGTVWVPSLLALTLMVTRFHHFGSAMNLPDASLAVFFLAGLAGLGRAGFWGLVLAAVLTDAAAVGIGGVSAYCLSPAYVFLLPTYAVMMAGGQWVRKARGSERAVRLLLAVPGTTIAAHAISSFSFYLFSGKVTAVDAATYALAVIGEWPAYLGSTAVYVALAMAFSAVFGALRGEGDLSLVKPFNR